MNDINHQKKLGKLLNVFERTMKDKIYSALVVGSYAHSRNYDIKPTSDLDLIVICKNTAIKRLFKTPLFSKYKVNIELALSHLKSGTIDLISTRHKSNGCLFTIHFMSPKTYIDKFSSPKEKRLFSFRKIKKNYTYRFQNFNSEYIEIKTENYLIGGGYKVPMDTCKFINGKYFSGSPHNKLMSYPLILFDKLGIIEKSITNLRINLIQQMIKEYGDNTDFDKISIMNTLVEKYRIAPNILRELIKLEKIHTGN